MSSLERVRVERGRRGGRSRNAVPEVQCSDKEGVRQLDLALRSGLSM